MQNNFLAQFDAEKATRWFYIFLFIHIICWTVVPDLVRLNLPLDAIEGTIWGKQLEWGYDKDPYLNAWVTAIAMHIGGQASWIYYFFCQLSVAAAFWSVWQIGYRILTPSYALIAVMLLEGIQYFNFHALDFNDNTLELGCWALTILSFYHATHKTNSLKWWLLTGLFAALSLMAKYYTVVLLLSMTLFLITNEKTKKCLNTYPPYAGLILFLAIISPHFIWLCQHDFMTVKYVVIRGTSEVPSWLDHFYFPIEFAWQQFQVLIPAFILFLFLIAGKKPIWAAKKIKINTFDKNFLLFIAFGPFLITLLLSLIAGTKLRAGWGMPILTFWPLTFLAFYQPAITKQKLTCFITSIFMFIVLLLTGYSYSLINSKSASTANFPGQEIATKLTHEWRERYPTKLMYVAGSRWVGGNIEFYSPDHPTVYVEWNKRKSPWINEEELKKHGGMFVWEMSKGEFLPPEVKAKYPNLTQPIAFEFQMLRNQHHLEPIKLGVAFLPPAK